jgi:hypothetical protein
VPSMGEGQTGRRGGLRVCRGQATWGWQHMEKLACSRASEHPELVCQVGAEVCRDSGEGKWHLWEVSTEDAGRPGREAQLGLKPRGQSPDLLCPSPAVPEYSCPQFTPQLVPHPVLSPPQLPQSDNSLFR